MRIVGARHPCVELQDGVTFIANDYVLERRTSRFQIVTGPNMGGKSTFIRGLGSLVAMAQVTRWPGRREVRQTLEGDRS